MSRHDDRRSTLVSIGVAALVIVLTGCAAGEDAPRSPFQADFDQAMTTTTEFQRSVLEDYEITDAEYSEARNRFKACVEDEGYTLLLEADGTRMEGIQDGQEAAADAVFTRCQDENLGFVEPFYYELRENPQNEDRTVLLVDCLQRADVLDESVDADDVLADPGIGPAEDPRVTECDADPKNAFPE